MPIEPVQKRIFAFVDGQNLFGGAKTAFGYRTPNYKFPHLAEAVCNLQRNAGWELAQTRFYTGVPDLAYDPNPDRAQRLINLWDRKRIEMEHSGVICKDGFLKLRYSSERVLGPDGKVVVLSKGHEKGIDIRIALDIVRYALRGEYDVALLFSSDQDFREVAKEIRAISVQQKRWLKMASAFPRSDLCKRRGVEFTDWIPIERELYDSCIEQ